MRNTDTPDADSSRRLWLTAAIVSLFLLAALSSADASFVYIFLGTAAFCFFMAMRGWLTTITRKNEHTRSHRTRPRQDFSFDSAFKGAQHQQAHASQQKPFAPADGNKTARRLLAIVGAILMFFVLLIVFVIAFGDDDFAVETEYYTAQADLFLGNNEYDSAKVNYRRVLRYRPDDIAARMGYGKALYYQEQYDSAIIMFNGVSTLEPENAEAKLFRGRSYYFQKRYTDATVEAEQLMIDEPDYNEAKLLAGDIYYTQERYDEALKYYEPAYAAGARSATLCWIMAWIYDEKKRDTRRAIPFYKEALEYDNTVVGIYQRLSEITQEPEAAQYRAKVAELQEQN